MRPAEVVVPEPIGQSVPRRDALAKVTGQARFTVDLTLPGMAHAKILRSPQAHARIRSIDVSAARRRPGVLAVVSAADLPDVDLVYGHAVRDHPLIARDVVRFVGEPVVGVVAEDPVTAEEALADIEVEYEPLPWVTDPLAALEPDAPVIHADAAERGQHGGFEEAFVDRPPNLCSRVEHGFGDIEAAFDGAHLVVDEVYAYPMAYAYAMEPYNAIADFQDGRLTVWSSAQHPFMVRADLARCFRLPLASVRVAVPYVGGGYGSKSYTKIEPLTAALALRAGRPVRLALSVEESIVTTRSVSTRIRLQTAFDADGTIRGRRGTIWANAGAYAENAPRVAHKAMFRVTGPYRIPAVAIEALTVYTNCAPGSSYRGLGAPQAVFAGESQIDEAAGRLGIDPLELRVRNALRRDEPMWPGARGMDADIEADLRLAAELIEL
ncbi:MAG TPA: molybdopterin cofactor-binding domain-containing protein, partial [Candidatus Limnocylindrales bacterium]|nr:molybdopterin cofactor-binding domain-containing protein [Candidatus Limnocylindrales bacterium]